MKSIPLVCKTTVQVENRTHIPTHLHMLHSHTPSQLHVLHAQQPPFDHPKHIGYCGWATQALVPLTNSPSHRTHPNPSPYPYAVSVTCTPTPPHNSMHRTAATSWSPHAHRYWWMGDPGPSAVLPTEKNAAATLAAQPSPFSGFVAVEQLQQPLTHEVSKF